MKRVLPFLFAALVMSAVFALVALMTTHRGETLRAEVSRLGKKAVEAVEKIEEETAAAV